MNGKIVMSIVLLAFVAVACSPAAPDVVATQLVEFSSSARLPQPTPVYLSPVAQSPRSNSETTGEPLPRDNFFQDYGVNPYIDTREDQLSTFGLDVDTASYSIARRYVQGGNLPPPEAVRVEEFVNYFQQDYPTPPGVAFGIYADGAPSPFQSNDTQLIRVGIQGYQVAEWERKPASLVFVIDVSGSMDMENRLGLVKRSLQLLVERLGADDRVAIVVYGSKARIVLEPTRGDDHHQILAAIYSLKPEGATNAEAGLSLGYRVADSMYSSERVNRVVLCSDGVANVGETGPDQILKSIRGYAEQGITLTSVGFGMGNFNDVLMEQLANKGNGNYAYVDTLDEARRIFVDDLTSTIQVIALDAKVQVDFNPEVVERYQLLGYENRALADEDFRNDAVDAGEIGAGHSVTALYAVRLHPGAQGRIMTVQLRWQDAETHEVNEINGNFNTWQLAQDFYSASPRYQLSVIVAQYAALLRQSPWAMETSASLLAEHAKRLASLLGDDSEVAEFASLVNQAIRYGLLER